MPQAKLLPQSNISTNQPEHLCPGNPPAWSHPAHDQHVFEDGDVLVDTEEPGDVTSGANAVTVCIEQWCNAGPDDCKRMWSMFIETGIFLAACRHGFILMLCDMIQSGEL